MRVTGLAVAVLLIGAAPVSAETALSPQDFRAHTEGWTLYYEKDGVYFGAERLERDQSSTWMDAEGNCLRGAWREYGDAACFVYEQQMSCWTFSLDGEDLIARLIEGEETLVLRSRRRDHKPLLCPKSGEAI